MWTFSHLDQISNDYTHNQIWTDSVNIVDKSFLILSTMTANYFNKSAMTMAFKATLKHVFSGRAAVELMFIMQFLLWRML